MIVVHARRDRRSESVGGRGRESPITKVRQGMKWTIRHEEWNGNDLLEQHMFLEGYVRIRTKPPDKGESHKSGSIISLLRQS